MAVYPFVRIAANNLGFTVHVDVVSLWILGVAGVGSAIVGLAEWLVGGSSARVATFLIPWVWLLFNFHLFERLDSRPHLLWVGATAVVGAVMVVIQADHGTQSGRGQEPQPDHRYKVLSALRLPCEVPSRLANVDVMDAVTACHAGVAPTIEVYERFSLHGFTVRSAPSPIADRR